jgi:hypothetical protein
MRKEYRDARQAAHRHRHANSDAALSEPTVERAVRDFGDALEQASGNGQRVVATVTMSWEPALPMPGTMLAALVTVLGDRGHDPEVIAERIGEINEDELWQHYLGPAADRLGNPP